MANKRVFYAMKRVGIGPADARAIATIEFMGAAGPAGAKITLTATDGTQRIFTSVSSSPSTSANPPEFEGGGSATATATSLKATIEAAVNGAGGGLGGRITVAQDAGKLTLTQATGGTDGNTAITVADQSSTTIKINGATAAANPTGAFDGSFIQARGVQTVASTTSFIIEQAFELGQLPIYENIEGIPNISLQADKILDGRCPIYLLSTGQGSASANTLSGKANEECSVVVAVYDEADNIAGSATTALSSATNYFVCKNLQIESVSYSIPVQGNATESITFVGNDKDFAASSVGAFSAASLVSATDGAGPKASTGISRRADVKFTNTRLPTEIPGVSNSSSDSGYEYGVITADSSTGNYPVQIQSISITANLPRETVFELGNKAVFSRHLTFPAQISCDITIHSLTGDQVDALASNSAVNTKDQNIRIALEEGLIIDLGQKNRLSSVSLSGGDVGGGNEQVTYSYQTFNDFTVVHAEAPDVVSRTL